MPTLDLARERRDVDAEFLEESLRDCAVRPRAVDLERAAVDQLQPPVEGELVALGVAAEVVVIVEDQDARPGAGVLAIVMRRGQAADAAAHDDEIVLLARLPE